MAASDTEALGKARTWAQERGVRVYLSERTGIAPWTAEVRIGRDEWLLRFGSSELEALRRMFRSLAKKA